MNNKVNYEVISQVYNSRYMVSPLDGVNKFLEKILTEYRPKNVLEVGCGTCHWLTSLSKYNINLLGADFSIGMLKEAQKSSSRLMLTNADANHLPFRENCFDLIIVINAIHQFGNHSNFISSAYKLLNSNGILSIIGLEPRESKDCWFLYRYFERTYEIDLLRYPTFNKLKDEMVKINFSDVNINPVHKIDTFKKGDEILNDHFIDKRGASQLALLSDEEYQTGINKINIDINQAKLQQKDIVFETRLNFYAVTGTKH